MLSCKIFMWWPVWCENKVNAGANSTRTLSRNVSPKWAKQEKGGEKKQTYISRHVVIFDKDKVAYAHENTQKGLYLGWDLLWFGKILRELGRKHLRTSNLNTDTLIWKWEHERRRTAELIQNIATVLRTCIFTENINISRQRKQDLS